MNAETQPARDASPPPSRRSRGPRIAAIVVAGLSALLGVGLSLGGGAILLAFGGDGEVASGYHEISTPTSALVSEVADIEGMGEVGEVLGDPEIRLSVRPGTGTREAFVGIGPAAAVERYLASAPIEEISDVDLDPFELRGRRLRRGSKLPAPPASRSFWVAHASGDGTATMRWKVRDGDYRLVVMNADGSRKVGVDSSVGVTIPHIARLGWILLGLGLLLIVGAGVAIFLAARSLRADR
jgi:hypothetical protein